MLENTLQYDPYEDNTQNKQTFLQQAKELRPILEVGDHYIGADMLLHRGNQIARSHVVAWSCDANGNVMGGAHANIIQDTRAYQVEFSGGEVIALTTYVIAKSMYVQCDIDWNEHLILDLLIDYQKYKKPFPLQISRPIFEVD